MNKMRSIALTSVLPAVLMVGATYQTLMAVNGPEGLHRAAQLEAKKAEHARLVEDLVRQRLALEERADRLVLASLDEDLLEESVRQRLGHMRPGEYRVSVEDLDRVASTDETAGAKLTNLIAVALLDEAGA